jgi:hypothetical protein
VEATKGNEAELESNHSVRRGYMGYLTAITTELVRLAQPESGVPDDVRGTSWPGAR